MNSSDYFKPNTFLLIPRLCGWLVLVIAIVDIIGWHTKTEMLIRVFATFVPMYYNTACTLLTAGIGLLAAAHNKKILSLVCGIVVFIVSVLTLIEYVFYLDLGIDQLIVKPFFTVPSSNPGRMAIITVWGLLFTSFIFFSNLLHSKPLRFFCIRLSASIVLVLGCVPLAGYISGVEIAYSFGQVSRMAVGTALAFTLLGLGGNAFTWQIDTLKARSTSALWLATLASTIVFLFTLAICQQTLQGEKELAYGKVQEEATIIKHRLTDQINDSVISLRRMVKRWEVRGGTPYNEWSSDAANYIADSQVLTTIEWVDNGYYVRWIEPSKGNEKALNLYIAFDKERKKALDGAANNSAITFTPPLDLVQGYRGVIVYLPIYVKSQFEGFIVGIYNTQKLAQNVISTDLKQLFDFKLMDGSQVIFGTLATDMIDPYSITTTLTLFNKHWVLIVHPKKEFFDKYSSFVPYLELFGGFLISLLMGFAIFSAVTATQRNKLLIEKSEALVRSEERQHQLVAIIDESSDFIGMADMQGNLLYHNTSARLLVGLPKDYDMSTMKIADMHPEWAAKKVLEEGIPAVLKDGHWYEETALRHHQSGQEIPVLQTLTLHRDEQGNPVCLTTFMRDITTRKKAEAAQEHLINQLANSNMELERFAYVASHDMQEPLRMVVCFSDLLEKNHGESLNEEAKEYLNLIKDSGKRMQEMVNDLLEYSRVCNYARTLKIVDGDKELRHALDNLQIYIEESKAEIVYEALPSFVGNPIQFMRLLQNLITNAIKYQPADNIPYITIHYEDKGDQWQIAIQDNGLGIADDFTEQVFQPFRRLHRWDVIKGTGLGLAICKKIVENHGGKIWVEPAPEKGSIFYFTLDKDQPQERV